MGVISRFRNIMPSNAKLTIYKSAILSHLTYCSTVWYFCKVADKRKIERLQEKALRVVYCDKSTPFAQLLIKANLPSLQNRRLQGIAILMYKVKSGSAAHYIKETPTTKETSYELRNSNFVIPKFRTVKDGQHSIRHFGPYLWSKLERTIKEVPTIHQFKRSIRRMDIETRLDCRLIVHRILMCRRELSTFGGPPGSCAGVVSGVYGFLFGWGPELEATCGI